jgi:hypothetical protein
MLERQHSRNACIEGRTWGQDRGGVWVDDGCRATFKFDKSRGGDHPRAWGYRDSGDESRGEQRVRCESRDGRRNECNAKHVSARAFHTGNANP